MDKLKLDSIAKINIGLHIVGKRSDGYHLLETLFYPVPELFDEIILERREGEECEVEMVGMEEKVPLEKNLVWRAWQQLKEAFPDSVGGMKIVVEKRIPAGAGLGGGSSNAGTVLRGIREMMGLAVSDAELAGIGESLGADVPFFIYQRPLYATGIGTTFEELPDPLPGFQVKVFPQPFHSSTPGAYWGLDLRQLEHPQPLKELLTLPVEEWNGKVLNDLETSVFPQFPALAEEKANLYAQGAVYAAMTGSGSAMFGIFPDH